MTSGGYSSVFCGQLDFDAPKPPAVSEKPSIKVNNTNVGDKKPVYSTTKTVLKDELEKIKLNKEEGVRRITEKYDSPGNLMTQPASGFNTGIELNSPTLSVEPTSPVIHTSYTDISGGNKNMIVNGSAMSDGSSELSWPGSALHGNIFAEGVQEHDLLQVEMFYRSHKTEVTVGKSLANLYFGSERKTNNVEKWDFVNTGIPVLVLDTGDHLRNRKLTFILAEKGTGFTLWKDSIDALTKYSSPSANFHTMHVSTEHSKLAGISFDDTNAAAEFYSFIQSIMENPDEDLLALSKKKKKKKEKKEKKPKFKPPKRSDISQPCCFVHITKLEPPAMLAPPKDDSMNELSDMVRDRLEIPRSESSEISEDSTSHSERL